MLCEISHRIYLEVGVAQQDRAGLGDREGGAHDREIDVRQVSGLMHLRDVTIALDLRDCRTDDLGARDLRANGRQCIRRRSWLEQQTAHPLEIRLENREERYLRRVVEQRDIGKRTLEVR